MSYFLLTCLSILFIFAFPENTWAEVSHGSDELVSGYITVIDESNTPILQTGLTIHAGDQYINENNDLYEIASVEGALAKARFVNQQSSKILEQWVVPVQGGVVTAQPVIAIYHTHTDESYTPTDGAPTTTGRGSIMQVGDTLAQRLTERGYQVIHDKTLHDPHDANAYQRSRRTFMKLLAQQPATLFDIHRDSGPLSMYKTTIDGLDAAKILLVVGQQNQNKQTTLDYAKTIKSSTDAKYKGLIRGIFIAHGNYNQDLNPRSMLIEFGTQFNTLDAAKHSAAIFADVVPSFIAINSNTTPEPLVPSTPTAVIEESVENAQLDAPYRYDIAYILSAFIIGIIAYLYLSTGSWHEAKRKLVNFYKYEFINYLGPRKKGKK